MLLRLSREFFRDSVHFYHVINKKDKD